MFVESIGTQKGSLLNVLKSLSRKHCSIGDDLWWQMVRSKGTPLIIDTIGEYAELHRQLSAQRHNIQFRLFDEGHDRLCWRGGIIESLSYVFKS